MYLSKANFQITIHLLSYPGSQLLGSGIWAWCPQIEQQADYDIVVESDLLKYSLFDDYSMS